MALHSLAQSSVEGGYNDWWAAMEVMKMMIGKR